MATTTNFGWETPDDTDLVKDGALAIRTLGSAIDTSLVDLKGGTTGQVLSKTSNTDMDFTWVAQDDSNAIQNTIVDAKGDLITATGSDVPARLAVGNNGDTLLADSSTSTGLRWQGNFAAGKNKIINGDFAINQRAFSSTTTYNTFGFDRFQLLGIGGTSTYSAQTFTPGTAPVAGYEAANFVRLVSSGQSASNHYTVLRYAVEDVRTFAGQTATLSFWAKANTGTPFVAGTIYQSFGTGGSSGAYNYASVKKLAITTSWERYSFTIPLSSISGKTIGTGSSIDIYIWTSAGTSYNTQTDSMGIQSTTIDIWGVQLEAGNTATAFQTATGTLAGELAACQRYYYRLKADAASRGLSAGMAYSTGFAWMHFNFPVEMRTRPTALEQSGTAGDYQMWKADSTKQVCTAVPVYDGMTTTRLAFFYTTTGSGLVAGNATYVESVNSNAFLGWSAEL
jgi:hypothetical protein